MVYVISTIKMIDEKEQMKDDLEREFLEALAEFDLRLKEAREWLANLPPINEIR